MPPQTGDSTRRDGGWDPNIAPDEGATLVPGGGSRGSDGGSGSGSGLGGSFSGSLSDRFEIVGPLGEGGMGVVYKARDLRLGREVALKRLKADSVESHRLIDRFEREARTVASLEHPNIVRIYSVFDDADGLVIEMELLDGGSLQQRIDLEGALPAEEVARIGVQLCEALEAAHARGIVHRDIKPGNVLLTRRGTPKLADFGLAVERTKEGDGRQTVTGSLLGTPHYAAPEQLIDGKGVDARADLYSLGATLYAASTGTSPRAIRLDRVPESIRGVISKCLEERAEDRYQTAEAMREALQAASSGASLDRLPAELERLIGLALSDGVLTDDERTTLIKKAESLGLDGGEFGLVLDARVHASGARRQRSVASSTASVGTCLQCGASNESDVKFCGVCGADLFEKCPKCQRESRAGTKFCGGCRTEMAAFRESEELLSKLESLLASWDLKGSGEALSRLKELGTHR
ncbi:MAG: serine/threonine-protein kinase, partial [Phycisphaerales bacterium]